MDVATWLHSLGMQQYEPAFRGNAVLPELAAIDLKDLGASLVGDRRRLLAAIAALRNDIDPVPDRPVAPSLIEGRQLTAIFYDLLGSTAHAAGLDKEDLRNVVGAYHRAMADTVAPFEAFVGKYMGDGAYPCGNVSGLTGFELGGKRMVLIKEALVQQPSGFELAVNFRTAGTLGLTISLSTLSRAAEVIE